MAKFELVYFTGCPLVPRAKSALTLAGIDSFVEINKDKLPSDHAYRGLSSPSILKDGRLLAGSKGAISACSILDWSMLAETLRHANRPGNASRI